MREKEEGEILEEEEKGRRKKEEKKNRKKRSDFLFGKSDLYTLKSPKKISVED
ncbi:hypothetical protein [Segatella copri]|uniref:hypothetical protein n=1 Tax=Segatella copri TaxID=165179 RepID=UPI003F721DC7